MAAGGDELDASTITRHIEGMPADYVQRFDPEEILQHVRLTTPPPGRERAHVAIDDDAAAARVVVATADRPGILSIVSGVLALHDITVLDARVTTRADRVALDTFFVADGTGADRIRGRRWERVQRDLDRALAGDLDVEQALPDKAPGTIDDATVSVTVHGDPGQSIIEVRCTDRIALLHDLSRAIFDLGLSVTLAKVDTRGDRVVDVFYVEGSAAAPDIERALTEAAVTRR